MGEPTRHVRPRGSGRLAALALLVCLIGVLGVGVAVLARVAREDSPPATTAPALPPKPLRIVFPEGFSRAEMAGRVTAVNEIALAKRGLQPRLSARAYLRLTARSTLPGRFAGDGKRRPLEGFLFPATYEFLPTTTSAQLVKKQLAAFQREWSKLDLRYARSKNLTRYDVLIIASMIEKEAVAPEERKLVAAVIYNRLKARMPLQIDATTRYGLGVPATEPLRQSQLQSPSPYNTRIHRGLPPTPIANPGLASLRAAAHPARVNYLYFVRKPDKVHHFFTASYREFVDYANAHGF
jgi:peptidoglycan lytic transglycosylase G